MISARLALAAGLVTLVSGGVYAQPMQGFYIGGGLGATMVGNTEGSLPANSDSTLSSPSHNFGNKWEVGPIGVLSLGYGLGNGLRAEIEARLQQNKPSSATAFSRPVSGSGTMTGYGIMGNMLYDFDLRSFGINTRSVVPYAGVGLGYMVWSWDNVRATVDDSRQVIDDQDGIFGLQAILGLSFPISAVPGLSLTAEYRYYNEIGDPEMKATVTTTTTGTTNSQTIKIGNVNHSGLVGLRYAFGTAPAIVPTAPPASARTFMVFFEWNRDDLNDRARQIIGEAAAARASGITRIEVDGYTDRSGSADLNTQLSIRRASAVAGELVRRGVPRNEIVTRGLGDENNLVPTAEGVREPQNRRVEIIVK